MVRNPVRKIGCLVLNIIIIVSVLIGVGKSMFSARNGFMGGMNALKYFTIQSNIAVGGICAAAVIRSARGKAVTRAWQIIRLAGSVSITLTGTVFCFVLAPTLGAEAWALNNVLTHAVVPVCTVAEMFISEDCKGLSGVKAPLWSLVPPIAYAIFAGIGYMLKWEFAPGENYPYFFLNWGSPLGAFGFSGQLPFMGCVWWILALMFLLLGVSYLYMRIVNIECGEKV